MNSNDLIPVDVALKGKKEVEEYISAQKKLEEIKEDSYRIGLSLFEKFEDIKKINSTIFNDRYTRDFVYYTQYKTYDIYNLLIGLESEIKAMIKESLKLVDNQRESEKLRNNTYGSME